MFYRGFCTGYVNKYRVTKSKPGLTFCNLEQHTPISLLFHHKTPKNVMQAINTLQQQPSKKTMSKLQSLYEVPWVAKTCVYM